MSSILAVHSPSSIASDIAIMMDLDAMSDIECGQPDPSLSELHFAENALLSESDDEKDIVELLPENDRVFIYKAKIQEAFDGVIPDYEYAHSSNRMFGKRGSSFRFPSFEFWRRRYDMCRFDIITLVDDDYNQWVDEHVLRETLDMEYLCDHNTRMPSSSERLRVRPACCDRYHRSCCWVDLSMTFHGSYGALSCCSLGANAPVPSFDVGSAALHPIVRTREYFHCGKSFGYPVDESENIDRNAIRELMFAFTLLRVFATQFPVLWCSVIDMLNPYEKMIFASMLYDGNAIDDYGHQLRCNRLYGFTLRANEHDIFHGYKQAPVQSIDDFNMLISNRRKSPCQRLMRYGGCYDLTNMLNRQAIRVDIVTEWRYKLVDIARILLFRIQFYGPSHDICWTMCSYEEKQTYIDVWRGVLQYWKIIYMPTATMTKRTMSHMLYVLDDVVRRFVHPGGLFSYLMSAASFSRITSCADMFDIQLMTWERCSDVKKLVECDDWNSGFRSLVSQTLMYLESDTFVLDTMAEIIYENTKITPEVMENPNRVRWRTLLADVVTPILVLWSL